MGNTNADYYFLGGGGEMGELIRGKDWGQTLLGDPGTWPQSLRTMVAMMLENPFGMYIAWGDDFIQLYNDGFRPILGANKHPQALGIGSQETFSEIWDTISPMFDGVMDGIPVRHTDLQLYLNRNGYEEGCYFDFSYSPIRNNDGGVGGVLVTVIETTDKKKAQLALNESNNQLQFAIDAAGLGIWDYDPATDKFTANGRLKEWFGLPDKFEMELYHATDAIAEKDRQRIIDAIRQSLDHASGGNYTETFTIIHPLTKSERIVQVRGKASFDEGKIAYRLNGTLEDVTSEVIALRKLEESETKLRLMIGQAPVAMCVFRGSRHVVEIANEKMLELWGRPAKDVMNKPIFEGLPEAKGQGLEPIVDNVFKTGETFKANERPVSLPRQGKIETVYINFVYEALKDADGAVAGIVAIASDVTTQVIARKKIEEKEEQLRIALEGGELGTFDYYPETGTLHWSDKTKELFGLPPGADANYNVYLNAIHPEDRNASKFFAEQQQAKLMEGGFYELEYRSIGVNDGRIRWVRSKGKVVYGVNNHPVRYTGVVQEITKRKEAEQALKESEERFRTIADNISQLAWMANEIGQMIWFNKRWLEYTGTTMEHMLNEGAKNIHHPEHRGRVMDKYLKAVDDGKEWEDTFPLLGADGQYRWFLSRATPIKNADGKVKQWFGTNTDITQRMESEEALKESEDKFRTMAESSDILIGVNDETVNAVYFNKVWEKLTGRSVEELMDLGWADLLHPDDRQPFLDKFFHAFKNKESYNGEFRILNKDGNYSWLYAQVQVRLHPNGSYAGHISSCIDITERKRSEEDIKRFKFMADNASEPFILMKNDGTFEYLNKAALEKWGYTAEEAKTLRVPDVDPIYDDEVFANIFAKAQIDDIPIFETLHKKKNGNIYPVEVNMGAFQIAGTPYLFAVARDISARKKAEEAVKESEQRLRSLVEGAPFPIGVYTGREMRIQFVNQSILDVWGKDRDVIGKKFADVLPELEGTGLYESLDKVFSTGIPFHDHNRPIYLNAFGKAPHYFNYSFTALHDASGKIYGVLNTAAEVTEMEIARQKVEESEERFRNVANSAPVLIWMAGTDKLCYFFNKGWLNFTGRTMEQESGNGWTEGVHPEDLRKCLDIYSSSFDKREPFHMEYRLKRHDGEYRWLSDNGVPRFTPDGKFEGYIGACMDINNEKVHQQELEESEQKFRLLADSMPQHIWTSDPEGNLNYYNRSVFDYSGLTPEQIYKGGWIQLVHPDDREENIKQWIDAVSTGKDFLFEHRFRRDDGAYRWQLSRAIPQRDETGKIQMWVGTSTDIQEQKIFSEELERQVGDRTRALAESNAELQKMNRELESFAYISSHDLQEPLRKIQTFALRILEKEENNLSVTGKEHFKRMQASAQRMQALIQDLLAYSRTNTAERKPETTDLNKIIGEVREDLQEELKQKQATIEADVPCDADIIPFQFRQLMLNLIGNSLKFTRPGVPPRIRVIGEIAYGSMLGDRLLPDNRYCHISVSDNGIGFEQQYSERIFEVFQRLHDKSEYEGTGIGLAIVKKIVENHNGMITASGEMGKGATFHIYIPAMT